MGKNTRGADVVEHVVMIVPEATAPVVVDTAVYSGVVVKVVVRYTTVGAWRVRVPSDKRWYVHNDFSRKVSSVNVNPPLSLSLSLSLSLFQTHTHKGRPHAKSKTQATGRGSGSGSGEEAHVHTAPILKLTAASVLHGVGYGIVFDLNLARVGGLPPAPPCTDG